MSTNTQIPTAAQATDDSPMVIWSIDSIQKRFLTENLPDYKTAFINSLLSDFWPTFFTKWFDRWPPGENTQSFVEEQLRGWMSVNSKWQPTNTQKDFLGQLIPDYKAAQESKTLSDFWPRLFANWFHRWSATPIAPQGLVEKKLKAWFNNHARVNTNTRQVLNLNTTVKRTRRPAESQTFCRVYWNRPVKKDGTTLAQIVNRGWVIDWKNDKKYDPSKRRPNPPVHYINAIASTVYEGVPHIHNEIRNHPDQTRHTADSSDEDDDDEEDLNIARAKEFSESIKIMPASLDRATQQLWQKAGFVSCMMVAGPNPAQGGNIVAYSITEGSIRGNCTFDQWCPNFARDFEGKFTEFARMVFPPAERARRTLPGTEHLRNYEVDAPNSTPVAGPCMSVPPLPPSTPRRDLQDQEDPGSDAGSDAAPGTPTPSGRKPSRLSPGSPESAGSPSSADKPEAMKTTDDGTASIEPATDSPLVTNDTPVNDNEGMDVDAPTTKDDDNQAAPTTNDDANQAAEHMYATLAPALSDAPSWLKEAIMYLCSLSIESRWREVVMHFIEFERSRGFLEGKITTNMLAPGKHRPKEVSVWIKAARVGVPTIKNSVAFSSGWRMWYHELQPESRKLVEGRLERVAPSNGEWTELCKGTVNGVYSLVASLGWCLNFAKANPELDDELTYALGDVSWTLDAMTQVGGCKRASSGTETVRSAKKARVE